MQVISIRVDIRQASQQNAVHEFGHFIDYTYSNGTYLSNNSDFQALFEKFKSTYKESGSGANAGYATSQATEFFATTFKDYLLYSNKLKAQVPEVYSYMENLNKTVLQ
ncbi:anthrax toxin lethal factor-related metalloendopeptidase [Anaerocolumna jejuensis]|uniref:anthrax toxin lethal factor-related metalloendopeptidase n=1 Tax=Anaerocolumna jejuensis TaxID=259063 RepID=UPI001114E355